MKQDFFIRMAEEADAQELLNIYTPYVTDTAITFEYTVPTVQEFANRIRHTLQRYPYLVLLRDGQICGYAYASVFKSRAAYDWAVETSVYLRQDCRGAGLGKALYLALEEALKRQNIINVNACISYPHEPNDYFDDASEKFHRHLGYTKVGHFNKCGYKFGMWFDMIWMEKMLGDHPDKPEPFIPITELQS